MVGPSRIHRLSSLATLLLCNVVFERSHSIADTGVFQVVYTFVEQAFCIRERVDLRAGDATQVSVQALHSGRELAVSEYQIGVHAFKHMLGSFPYIVVRKIDLFDNARQVREASAIVRSQDAFVNYVEVFELVHHVVPALQRQQRVVEGKVLRLFRRLLAVTIVFGVEVPDAVGLAERFDQERVVCPAGARNLPEADVVLVQERFAVNCRPNGRMVAEKMCGIGDGKRLLRRLDAAFVAAIDLPLLVGVGHPDAPVRRFHDVERRFFFELCGKSQHVGVHVRLDPVIRLDDGNPCASCLRYAAVASCAVALILLIDNFDTRIVAGKTVDGCQRVVGAAIIEQDYLQVLVRLPNDAVKALFQVGLSIVDRYDNRDKRFAHVLPSMGQRSALSLRC